MEYKDYYKTLGVERHASADAIKKAYRKLVSRFHPDVSQAKDADQKTKEINEAYGVLGEPEKRAAYDALASGARAGRPFAPPPDWTAHYATGAGGSPQDFFSDLFAQVGRRGSAAQGFAARGEDLHASMAIDLADAYHGASRAVSLRLPRPDARGRVTMEERPITVNIPKGVLPGQQVRVAGQGYQGSGGAEPGDLFLDIVFNPDRRLRIGGRDVIETIAVAPWEATLGDLIEVSTPSGQLQVNVPPGSQSGRKLRLKGRGIPGHPPGDLYLMLEVVLPPATSDQAREAYRTMAREMPFNPRAAPGPRA